MATYPDFAAKCIRKKRRRRKKCDLTNYNEYLENDIFENQNFRLILYSSMYNPHIIC